MKGRPPRPAETKRAPDDPSHRPPPTAKVIGGRITPEDYAAMEPPPDFSPDHLAAWHELMAPLVRSGILDRNDLPLVEAATDALVRMRWARRGMQKASQLSIINPHGRTTNPLVTVSAGSSAEFRQIASLLGIGPANRARYAQGAPGARPDGGLAGEMDRTLPARGSLRVVAGGARDGE